MGKINDVFSNGGFSVHLAAGYDINARNTTGLKLDMGDTVRCEQRSAGIWEIVDRITVHPDPVIPDPPSPPAKPSVTVPPAPAAGSSAPGISYGGGTVSDPASPSGPDLYAWAQGVTALLNTFRGAFATQNNQWRPLIDKAVSDAVTARTDVRAATQQVNGDVLSYVEDTGGAALDAVSDVADAQVAAGTAVRLPTFSIDAVKAANVAGFTSESPDAINAISQWLDHRVYWTGIIWQRLNSARAHFVLTPCPAIGTAAWDLTGLGSWSARVGRIQDCDDWFSNAYTTMLPMIEGVRAAAGLGTHNWPSELQYAWGGSTFPASKDALSRSLQAHHSAYTAGLGSGLIAAIRKVNGG